jgi:hypothetical protein
MPQRTVPDAIRARSLTNLETLDGLLDLRDAGKFRYICGSILVCTHHPRQQRQKLPVTTGRPQTETEPQG